MYAFQTKIDFLADNFGIFFLCRVWGLKEMWHVWYFIFVWVLTDKECLLEFGFFFAVAKYQVFHIYLVKKKLIKIRTQIMFIPFFIIIALTRLLTSLKDTESLSGEQELGFLQTLLESKELNALVNVHSKVAKIGKDDRLAPLLSNSMQVIFKLNLKTVYVRTHILS